MGMSYRTQGDRERMIRSMLSWVRAPAGSVARRVDRRLARGAARNAAVGIAESHSRRLDEFKALRDLSGEPTEPTVSGELTTADMGVDAGRAGRRAPA